MKNTIRVAGCIIRHENTILMLYRSQNETDPSLWGIPAGKVDGDEDDLSAVVREVFEETGLELNSKNIQLLGDLPIEYEDFIVVFPVFDIQLSEKPSIILNPAEHTEYRWLTVKQILELPDLMKDVDKIVYKFCIDKLGLPKD